MYMQDLCSKKVITIGKDATLLDAARSMRENHVGDLVVVEQGGEGDIPVGILTDRDIVVSVIAGDIDHFNSLTVADVMSFDLITAREEETLTDVLERMGSCGIRRIPIVNDKGALTGILAFDDIVCLVASYMKDMATLVCSERYREKEERG